MILTRWARIDSIVQEKITTYLSDLLEAQVTMEYFSFNDQQIEVSNVNIRTVDDQFVISVKKIYIKYHLLKLLFSRLKDFHAIENIRIFEPEVTIKIENKKKKSQNKKPDLEVISKYFKKLEINDGRLVFTYKHKLLSFTDHYKNIQIKVKNERNTHFEIETECNNSGAITANGLIKNNQIRKTTINVDNYQPEMLDIFLFKNFNSTVNAQLKIERDVVEISGEVIDTSLKIVDKVASSPLIYVSGNLDTLQFYSDEMYFDENFVTGNGSITNLLNHGKINVLFHSDSIALERFYHRLHGFAIADFKISGKLTNPSLSGTAKCEELIVENQKIRDIQLQANFIHRAIKLDLKQAYWYNNLCFGEGTYFYSNKFDYDLYCNNLRWYYQNFSTECEAYAKISYDDGFYIDIEGKNANILHPNFKLQDLTCKASLKKKEYEVNFLHDEDKVTGQIKGNFSDGSYKSFLRFKRFNLAESFASYSLPYLSGNIDLTSSMDEKDLSASLRLFDKAFGKLDGRFEIDFHQNTPNDKSYLTIGTHHAKFNYEDFTFTLDSSGTADSLTIKTCKINDEIDLDGWMRWKPSFDFGIFIKGKNVTLQDYLPYVMSNYTSQQITGKATFLCEYDSRNDGDLAAVLELNRFRFGQMKPLHAELQLYGSKKYLTIHQMGIFSENIPLIDMQSEIILQPSLKVKSIGVIKDIKLQEIFPEKKIGGRINGNINYFHTDGTNILDLELLATDCKINNLKADTLQLICSQKDKQFDLVLCDIKKRSDYSFSASGSIGYNFLNEKMFPDSNSINLTFQGDLLELISGYFSSIQEAKSECSVMLNVQASENGLSFQEGSFNLEHANLKLTDQVETIDRIHMKLDIKNNILDLKKCEFRMGEGRFHLKNSIGYDQEDFKLGNLNLGKFYARTNHRGLLLHIPGYIPNNSVVQTVIKGRYDDDFLISGPFDDMKFIGDVDFSNGGVIYPPNTENVLKLFGTITEEKELTVSEPASYPFSLDIMLRVQENFRYVTYPTNLLVEPGSFLHLLYQDDTFTIPKAMFTSKEGRADLLGTQFDVESVQVQINQLLDGVLIDGVLSKQAADGTLITMEVFRNRDEDENNESMLQFRLASDDPNDGTLDILSKLRYNRTMDEISDEEKKTLLQDEVIQLAGLGLESAIFDPLIHPIENQIRRLLRLDLFHVQTGIIKNFFNRYYYEKDDEQNFLIEEELDNITKFGSDMFLNNLSITMGKYVNRKLFFSYETQFQKPEEVAIGSDLGIYNNFTLRYHLSKQLKLSLRYKLQPFGLENSYELALERTWRFW